MEDCLYEHQLFYGLDMQRETLGNTGTLVSELCLGTMYFGTKTDQAQSEKLLDLFVQNGGNFMDTSNNYSFWIDHGTGDESEKALGKWFKRSGVRDKVVLATKCGARPTYYAGDMNTIKLEGLSYDTIIKAVEDSLRRLQTDYIDVLYGHIDFMEYPIDERLKAFTLLKEQGKIRFAGTSNTQAWRVAESQMYSRDKDHVPYHFVQQKYSFLRPKHNADFWIQKLLDEEMMSYASNNQDVTLVAYSTLLSGFYGKSETALPEEYATEDNRLRLLALQEVANRKSCTMNQVVLAWIMAHTPKIIPLISASKTAQLEESIKSVDCKLSKEEFHFLSNSGI